MRLFSIFFGVAGGVCASDDELPSPQETRTAWRYETQVEGRHIIATLIRKQKTPPVWHVHRNDSRTATYTEVERTDEYITLQNANLFIRLYDSYAEWRHPNKEKWNRWVNGKFVFAAAPANGLEVKVEQTDLFQSSEKQILVTAVDPTEKLVATGSADGKIFLRDIDASKLITTLNPSPGSVIDVAFHPSQPLLASVSYPNSLTLYNIETKQKVWEKKTLTAPMRVVFSRDGTMISSVEWGGSAAVYETETGRAITTIQLEQGDVGNVAFSADGKRLYVSTIFRKDPNGRSQVIECEARTGKVLAVLGQHSNGRVDRLRLSQSGQTLASLDRFGNLKLWDLANKKILTEWKLDIRMSRGLEFLDDRTLLVGGDDKILVVKTNQQKPVATINTPEGQNNFDAMPKRSVIVSTINTTTVVYKVDDPDKLPFVEVPPMPAENAVAQKQVMAPAADGPKRLLPIKKTDNVPNGNAYFDGLVSMIALRELGDAKLSLTLRSGATIDHAKLISLVFDSRHHGVKYLRYRTHAGQTRTTKPIDIYSLEFNGKPYHFRYWRPDGQLFLVNTEVELEAAAVRLAEFRSGIRSLVEHADQKAATLRSRKFLTEATGLLASAGKFQIVESKSALVFTDLPNPVAVEIGEKLDHLDQVLNEVFGVPVGRSIWYSKPIVAVFTSTSLLAGFEERVMNNPNHGGKGSVRRMEERWLQTVTTKNLDETFVRALCWGYSLGYCQLLHSDFNRYPWINAGIANTVPNLLLPDSLIARDRRAHNIKHLKRHQSLVGIITATRLDDSVKPLCGGVVSFLHQIDPLAFSQLFRDLKLGIEPGRALRNSYGITQEELASRFGRSLRVTGVVP